MNSAASSACHRIEPLAAFDPVTLPCEGDAGLVERSQPEVRDGDAVMTTINKRNRSSSGHRPSDQVPTTTAVPNYRAAQRLPGGSEPKVAPSVADHPGHKINVVAMARACNQRSRYLISKAQLQPSSALTMRRAQPFRRIADASRDASSLRRHGRQPAPRVVQRRRRPRPAGARARRRHNRAPRLGRRLPPLQSGCSGGRYAVRSDRDGRGDRRRRRPHHRHARIQLFHAGRLEECDRLALPPAQTAVRRQAGASSRARRRVVSAG